MDIISRLKTYLNSMNISNSQFADSCGIPRPTLSQLLNGRNKKISDEIISKIHDTYPSLSILWLLFGEGPMTNHENMPFSEGLNEGEKAESQPYFPINKDFTNSETTQNPARNFESNRNNIPVSTNIDPEDSGSIGKFDISAIISSNNTSEGNTIGGKKITNIVVFYSDNSFQSFKPSDE